MDEVAFAQQDAVHRIGHVPPNLAHPQPVGGGGDARDLDLACGQIQKEQNDEALQPSSGPDFHGEEIRGHNQFPVPRQKLIVDPKP
jgi:hypothetical protein